MDKNDYCQLKEMNVKFQLNLPSLVGMYGRHIQKKAKKLLRNKMYDYGGTDIHQINVFQSLKEKKLDILYFMLK
jgi:tyrosine-protein phosphatase YwqE